MNDKINEQKQQETQSYDSQAEPAVPEQEVSHHPEDANTLPVVQPVIPPEDAEEEDPETPYLASDMYNRIVALINKFESDLPEDMQAGGRLVSAGNITFSIQDVGFWDPNMIVFYGELSDGSKVELVQHLSQLNLLLVAVKRTDDIEKPRRVIGFNTKDEPEFADPEEDVE
jgi:hypothetical protein